MSAEDLNPPVTPSLEFYKLGYTEAQYTDRNGVLNRQSMIAHGNDVYIMIDGALERAAGKAMAFKELP